MKMTTLIIAVALATLAVFAAEAQASPSYGGSFGHEPPIAVLMKYKTLLQRAHPAGGQ